MRAVYAEWKSKLSLIPMEGKVQINSNSHFNAFMLMRAQRASKEGPNGEEGSSLKLREITGIPSDGDQTALTHTVSHTLCSHGKWYTQFKSKRQLTPMNLASVLSKLHYSINTLQSKLKHKLNTAVDSTPLSEPPPPLINRSSEFSGHSLQAGWMRF